MKAILYFHMNGAYSHRTGCAINQQPAGDIRKGDSYSQYEFVMLGEMSSSTAGHRDVR